MNIILSKHAFSKCTWLEPSAEKLQEKRTKLLVCEVGWGIGNFCMQGSKAIGWPGKKIPALEGFGSFVGKGLKRKEAFLLT